MALQPLNQENGLEKTIAPTNLGAPQRRSTDKVLERFSQINLVSPHATWYEDGTDFCFYAPAQEVCRETSMKLKSLHLSDEELTLLKTTKAASVLGERLEQIQAAEGKKVSTRSSARKKASSLFNGFAEFAAKTGAIVQTLLPQSPEYTVTFGIMVIVFRAAVTKREREDELSTCIASLAERLPITNFYSEIYPTNSMKAAVAGLYTEVMRFLDAALTYYRSGPLGKLVDAVIQPIEAKFKKHVGDIGKAVQRIESLKDAALVAQINDIKDNVQDTGRIVTSTYRDFKAATAGIGASMAMMNHKLDVIQTKTEQFIEFETNRYALQLRHAICSTMVDEDADLDYALDHPGPALSPKDNWQENGVLPHLLSWSRNNHSSLLWIGGTAGPDRTWVTDLSLDLIRAIQPQAPTLLYALCDRPPDQTPFSPRSLLKHLIAQLLTYQPSLAFSNPALCNERRFSSAESFFELWTIFKKLAAGVDSLFVIIDRIEECRKDEVSNVVDYLLPALVSLAGKDGKIGVIVTSEWEVSEDLEKENVTGVFIDTGRHVGGREAW